MNTSHPTYYILFSIFPQPLLKLIPGYAIATKAFQSFLYLLSWLALPFLKPEDLIKFKFNMLHLYALPVTLSFTQIITDSMNTFAQGHR